MKMKKIKYRNMAVFEKGYLYKLDEKGNLYSMKLPKSKKKKEVIKK